MTIKEKVLQALEEMRGEQVSGSKLAKAFGVSRSSIHKAVKSLREDGIVVSAVTRGGYRLEVDEDSLTPHGVAILSETNSFGKNVIVMPTVGSTNDEIKERYTGYRQGFTLIAESQTGGRGRLGRSFASPPGTGVYMSVLLHPCFSKEKLGFITLAAAVAVSQAIVQTAGFEPQIKWVNDVVMNGRKLCGILTEANIEGESESVSWVIVGVGINLRPNPLWSDEVKAVAGALSDFGKVPRRAVLAATFLSHFEKLYHMLEAGNEQPLVEAYRSRLCCLGKPITVFTATGQYSALCTGLTDEGHLLIQTEDGQTKTLHSGEISIREDTTSPQNTGYSEGVTHPEGTAPVFSSVAG